VEGIRRVLSEIGVGPSAAETTSSVVWFNMREEPVVYLNGKPHVLREHARPFKNMQVSLAGGTDEVDENLFLASF